VLLRNKSLIPDVQADLKSSTGVVGTVVNESRDTYVLN
jgi:hypothetical protein